jgi:hypothetical protein
MLRIPPWWCIAAVVETLAEAWAVPLLTRGRAKDGGRWETSGVGVGAAGGIGGNGHGSSDAGREDNREARCRRQIRHRRSRSMEERKLFKFVFGAQLCKKKLIFGKL